MARDLVVCSKITAGQHCSTPANRAAKQRAQELLEAYRRVRDAARSGGTVRVEAQPETDVPRIWVYLPVLR